MAERAKKRRELEARLESEWRSLLEAPSSASLLELQPERRQALGPVALYAQLEELREDWREVRGLVDPDRSARFVNASWTLKDLLAHLASWAREFRREVEIAARSDAFDYTIAFAMSVFGPTEWNEREVQARRERSLEAIFDEIEEETVRLQEIVIELPEPELHRMTEFPLSPTGDPAARVRGPLGFLVAAKCLHERHHLAQIRDRIRRQGESRG